MTSNKISTLAFYEHKNGDLVEKQSFNITSKSRIAMCKRWLKIYPFGICIAEFQDSSIHDLTVCY